MWAVGPFAGGAAAAVLASAAVPSAGAGARTVAHVIAAFAILLESRSEAEQLDIAFGDGAIAASAKRG